MLDFDEIESCTRKKIRGHRLLAAFSFIPQPGGKILDSQFIGCLSSG